MLLESIICFFFLNMVESSSEVFRSIQICWRFKMNVWIITPGEHGADTLVVDLDCYRTDFPGNQYNN